MSDVTPDQLKGVKALDIGLVIDQDLFATSEVLQINTVAAAMKSTLKPPRASISWCARTPTTATSSRSVVLCSSTPARQHAGTPASQHASANAGLHVVLAVTLNHDGVDAGFVKQLSEQMRGGDAADDRYRLPHLLDPQIPLKQRRLRMQFR